MVSMFHIYKITPAVDKDGNEIPIDTQHIEASVRYDP